MGGGIEITGMKELNEGLNAYSRWSTKSPSEILNTKCSFIARGATVLTKKTTKEQIDSELDAPGKSINAPLGAILANIKAKIKTGKGLYGSKMRVAFNKFKGSRRKGRAYLASTWLWAIAALDNAVRNGDISFSRRFAPKVESSTKKFGRAKGGATYARPVAKCYAEIYSSVANLVKDKPKVVNQLTRGLQKSIKQELASMNDYVKKKWEAFNSKKH